MLLAGLRAIESIAPNVSLMLGVTLQLVVKVAPGVASQKSSWHAADACPAESTLLTHGAIMLASVFISAVGAVAPVGSAGPGAAPVLTLTILLTTNEELVIPTVLVKRDPI